jgi:CcmD family protein
VALGLLAAVVVASPFGPSVAHASGELQTLPASGSEMPPPQGDDQLEGESELPWLFAVFAITWAAFFGYIFVLSRRQREMQREIEALRRALAEREDQAAQAGERSAPPES